MRTAQNVLDNKSKPNNIISPSVMVIEALKTISAINLSYLVVMDGDTYRGIFSERDYSRNVILKGRSSHSTRVEEVMATDLPVVSPPDTVEHCMEAMALGRTRYLVVLRNGAFEGVITIHDLLREVIASKEGVFDSTARQLLDNDEGSHIY